MDWKDLNKKDLKKFYAEWVKAIAASRATKKSIKLHLNKHLSELNKLKNNRTKDVERWLASMHNLLRIFEEVYDVKTSLRSKVKRLENHYIKHPEKSTAPPNKI